MIIGSQVGDSLPPCGSDVTITISTPSMLGDLGPGAAFVVGDEQRRHRFDFAVALDPGLEHLVVGELLDVGQVQGAAIAFVDHLRGDPRRFACDNRARRHRPPEPPPIS